ncbi:MAG: hypothetical protein LBJ61_09870, partial [Deltaproteobacteria bacterium]|nr:hypothetical protein [Deltaproteobacteria bacterium]
MGFFSKLFSKKTTEPAAAPPDPDPLANGAIPENPFGESFATSDFEEPVPPGEVPAPSFDPGLDSAASDQTDPEPGPYESSDWLEGEAPPEAHQGLGDGQAAPGEGEGEYPTDYAPETEATSDDPEFEALSAALEGDSEGETPETEAIGDVPEDDAPETEASSYVLDDESPETEAIGDVPEDEALNEALKGDSGGETPETEAIGDVPEDEALSEALKGDS